MWVGYGLVGVFDVMGDGWVTLEGYVWKIKYSLGTCVFDHVRPLLIYTILHYCSFTQSKNNFVYLFLYQC